MTSSGRYRNGVCPYLLTIDKKSIVEHTLLTKLWCIDLHSAKLEVAIWQISITG